MRATDMTQGRPARLIMAFALPMMAGNICQQLYTIVDAAFVGRFAGIDALAAVGAADWLCWLFLGVVMGCTQGFPCSSPSVSGRRTKTASAGRRRSPWCSRR